MSKGPIGLFDSGIGGFTVAKAIKEMMPGESLLYFGDTAHLPYGDKSPEAILNYSKKIAAFLVERGAKVIVIACNSASSIAYDYLHKTYHKKIPVISVVEPVVNYVVEKEFKKVGIIGTKATIKTEAHTRKIHDINPKIKVASLATPLLAPMVEEGFYNNKISQTIIDAYLANWKLNSIKALVLACTHYPLIKKQIQKYYKNQVEVIDTTEIVATAVFKELKNRDLLNNSRKKPADLFYVSDYTASFEHSTRLFFGQEVKLEKIDLWGKN